MILGPCLDVEFHPKASAIGAASTDGCVKIYDIKSGSLQQCYTFHTGPVNKARFHPNGKFMLTASHDSTLKVCVILKIIHFLTNQLI